MKFKVYDNYGHRPEPVKSVNSGVMITESAGYRSVATEIENMVISGQVFNEARESFDYPDGDISEVKHIDTYDMDDFDKADLAKKIRKDIGQAIEAQKAAARKQEIENIRAELKAEMAAQSADQPAKTE